MEKYTVTPTGLFVKVHADVNGTPFILIQGEFLKELGFYENTKLEILKQHDELILFNAEKYAEPKRRTNTEKQIMINDISDLTYDLITSEIPDDEAGLAFKHMDALTDELQNKILCDTCENNDNTNEGEDVS
jgi:hypothetical protein